MNKRDKFLDELCDHIYESLKEIEKEEELGKIYGRALISDCLSEKLYRLGYRRKVKSSESV